MKCSNPTCVAELKDDAKFCGLCGFKVPQPQNCRHCGHLNLAGAMFCGACGKSQSEPVGVGGALSNADSLGEFIYELTEERVLSEGYKSKPQPHMGFYAYKVVNGIFEAVKGQKQKTDQSEKDDTPSVGGFIKNLWDNWIVKPLLGERKEDAERKKKATQIYVMLDLRDSPLLSKTLAIPVPGLPDAQLRCEFWVNPDNKEQVALFKERVVGTRSSLTCLEFTNAAVDIIEKNILPGIVLETIPSNPLGVRTLVREQLEKLSGITVSCIFNRGKLTERHQLDISKSSLACPSCGHALRVGANFCGKCATDVSQLSKSSATNFLQAAGGQQLTLRLSMLIDRSLKPLSAEEGAPEINVSDAQITDHVINILGPVLRRYDVPTLMRPVMLAQLSNELNEKLVKDWRGYITEFTVVDLRTAEDEWFFNTEALLAEKLREIKADQKYLAIEQSQIELEQSAFNLVMQRIQHQDVQELAQLRQEQNKKKQLAELELDDHQLEISTDLRKAVITDDAEKELFARQRDKELREQEYLREQAKAKRSDELEHVDHDMTLEKKVAQHDIDLSDLTGEAQSRAKRRDITDESFVEDERIRLEIKAQEEKIRLDVKAQEDKDRLDAKRKELLGNIDEDLEDRKEKRRVEKIKELAALDAQLAQQEHEQELKKTQQQHDQELNLTKEANALEQAKLDAMKDKSAAEMLAMQARELAKAAAVPGGEAAAEMIKAMAVANADTAKAQLELQSGAQIAAMKAAAAKENAEMQAAMFERMLQMQKESADSAIRAHESAANRVQQTSDKAMGNMMHVAQSTAGEANAGYKAAADIAERVNTSSMENMSKVASASAAHSNDGMKEAVQSSRAAAATTIEKMADVYTAAVKATRYVCVKCNKSSSEGNHFCLDCGSPVQEQSGD